MDDITIGIDLGTTNSCAAYYIDNEIKIFETQQEGRLTPSVVAYTENNVTIVGYLAKRVSLTKQELCVSEIKRLLGRKTRDPYIQANLKYFPFSLDENSDEPVVLIHQKNQTLKKSPVEICTEILKTIKHDVENHLEGGIQKAVITVPAYFNVAQREATLEAANAAGFTVLKLMNEPTAAALSYYHMRATQNEKYSLVFDFGGGTLDVAILKRLENDIEIIGVDGDSHLGGQDIDNLIVDSVCNKLEQDYKFNCRENGRLMRRLRSICEEAKKDLSFITSASMDLDGFVENEIKIELHRFELEHLAADLFTRSLDVVRNCLENCNLSKNDIGDIILSGGSTRIPKLRQMLSEFFDGKGLEKLLHLDECVAEGAALQAAMFSTNPRQKIEHIRITDVTALSLGIASLGDVMCFVIKRNTPLPATRSSGHVTISDQQRLMCFRIYEGERTSASKNRFLGQFTIENLTPAPPGVCTVILTMTIDTNGILKVEAKEKLKDNTRELTVTFTRGTRSDGEVKFALKDAEDCKEEDKKFIKFAAYKIYLIKYCNQVVYNLEVANLVETNKKLYDSCKKNALDVESLQMEQEEVITELIKKVEKECHPLVDKYDFKQMPSLEDVVKNLNCSQFLEMSVLNGEIFVEELASTS